MQEIKAWPAGTVCLTFVRRWLASRLRGVSSFPWPCASVYNAVRTRLKALCEWCLAAPLTRVRLRVCGCVRGVLFFENVEYDAGMSDAF